MEFYTGKEVKKMLNISDTTLMRYRNDGLVKFSKISERKFLYEKNTIDMLLNGTKTDENVKEEIRKNVIYARVSTTKQKDDLIKQEQLLKDFCNTNGIIVDEIFSEVASGMNENRSELNKLIKLVTENKIEKIYITYKDRLTRFGFGYIEYLCNLYNTKIVILNNTINKESFENELSNDLISIIHHFSMKLYGKRRSELNTIKKQLETKENGEIKNDK